MSAQQFNGFEPPTENWSKLPHQFIDALPLVETIGEMKVILYILRHTWGFQDDEKKITLDEFANGRRRRDRTRLDNGTGLSKPTIINGLKRAIEHGFIQVEVDERDKGRVKKFYSLCASGVKKLDPICKEAKPRSEKETLERNLNKEKATPSATAKPRERKLSENDKLKTHLTDYFSKQTNIPPPEYNTQRKARSASVLWWGPLLEIAKICDKDLDRTERLIGWALKHCDDEGLTVSSPKSIVQIAIAEQAKRKRGNGNESREQVGNRRAGHRTIEDYGPDDEIQPGVTRAMVEAAKKKWDRSPARSP
jgi:DNA-binding PadR family transcriptional regulator